MIAFVAFRRLLCMLRIVRTHTESVSRPTMEVAAPSAKRCEGKLYVFR